MKKILLAAINAKYIHSNLAVYHLKAAAGKYGDQIEIGEYTINQQPDQILGDIYRRQPDVVAFSCYIWNREFVGMLLEEIPKILPDVKLWAGGPEVSFDAEAFLREHPRASGVMRGEGEGVFPKLAAYYIEETGAPEEIRGLSYRDADGRICSTPDAEPVEMDEIPFVCGKPEEFRHKIIYYESSRGCPFRCAYCLSSLDKRLRYRSTEKVKRELSVFLEAQAPQVKFLDRTFNCDPKRSLELWSWIREHDNGVTNFHFEIAADLLTEEELRVMEGMRPGLIQLEIGVQSTNMEVIRRIDRVMDLERLRRAVARVKSFGNIHQHLDLIAGLPGEDLESFRRSFDEVFSMRPDQLQLGFLKVLKGTRIWREAEQLGVRCHSRAPYEVLSTPWLSYGDVLTLKGVEEMVEVYYNSRQFEKTLEALLEDWASAFDFFRKLAEHYEKAGYSQVSHSRMARYDILREFAGEEGRLDDRLDRCMVFDLYARERRKSRPAFASDRTPYRDRLREYERKYGKQVHIEVFEEETGPRFVLFDYDRRDPLTGQAHVEELK
ncbi:MAG: B12-binding domain-containing radical SAM protein [Eubacteriales bacterium]|nr:B12-binding domain-containing radical SAM protein [Eubacteriales bacterium]